MVRSRYKSLIFNCITGVIIGNVIVIFFIGWPLLPHLFFIPAGYTFQLIIFGTVSGLISGVIFSLFDWLATAQWIYRLVIGLVTGILWAGLLSIFVDAISHSFVQSPILFTQILLHSIGGGILSAILLKPIHNLFRARGSDLITSGSMLNIVNGLIWV